MSVSVTGVGLTPIVMPQLVNILLDNYGLQGTILVLGGYSLNAFIGAMLLKPLPKTPIVNKFTNGTTEVLKLEGGRREKEVIQF